MPAGREQRRPGERQPRDRGREQRRERGNAGREGREKGSHTRRPGERQPRDRGREQRRPGESNAGEEAARATLRSPRKGSYAGAGKPWFAVEKIAVEKSRTEKHPTFYCLEGSLRNPIYQFVPLSKYIGEGAPEGCLAQGPLFRAKRAFSCVFLPGSARRLGNNAGVGCLELHRSCTWAKQTSETRSPSRRLGSWI